MKKSNKGFTLMEMLIVIAIIAILIAIAIPTFTSALERSRQKTDLSNARSLKSLVIAQYMSGDLDIDADNTAFYLKNGGQAVTTTASEGIKTKAQWKDHSAWADTQVSCTFNKGGVYVKSVPNIEDFTS